MTTMKIPDNVMMPTDGDKKGFKKTEWNLQQGDTNRIIEICMAIDEVGVRVRSGNFIEVDKFYGLLKGLYIDLKPIMSEDIREEFMTELKSLSYIKATYHRICRFKNDPVLTNILITRLDEMQEALYCFKQYIGLGIPVSSVKTKEQRIKRAMK